MQVPDPEDLVLISLSNESIAPMRPRFAAVVVPEKSWTGYWNWVKARAIRHILATNHNLEEAFEHVDETNRSVVAEGVRTGCTLVEMDVGIGKAVLLDTDLLMLSTNAHSR